MSPLSCSLLALAALLAVATAEPDPFCGELIQGIRTYNSRKFELRGTGGMYSIPDECKEEGFLVHRIGQHVVVCNEPNSKPRITHLPNPNPSNPFQDVLVDCPNNTYGCEDVKVEVTQYCDFVYP